MLARVKVLYLTMLLVISLSCAGRAQSQDDSATAQKATAEKFLQLLLSRPQPGTALDKTVEYYQSIGELDALYQRIQVQATEKQISQPEVAARHWLALALIAQSQTRWLESIELLRQAPDVAEHRWSIGQAQAIACEQLQRWPATIAALQPLIDEVIDQPGLVNADSAIEGARRLAKAYARVGQSDKAITVWRKLEVRFGRDEQIATRLASMAADEGELDFAVEVLDRILAGKLPATKRMELAIQRTSLIARAGQEEKAIVDYEQLLAELNAGSWLATDIAQRIEDLIVGRDGVEALLTYYRSQLARRPDDMGVILRLASTLDSEKQWPESNQLFKQLIERTSTATAPRLAYAQSLVHQELWHAAAAEFAKLAEQQPRNDDVITQWCEALTADETLDTAKREEQVRAILEKRLVEAAPAAAAFQQLAARLQRFGQSERAAYWLAKAFQLKPDDLSVLSDYCRALFELHREAEISQATSAFEAAHRSNRDILSQLSDLYWDLGYEDLAIACLSRANQLGPNSAMRFRLSDWLEKAQRPIEAAEQLELAWNEIAAQTSSRVEQESLCEDITRRQIQLAVRLGKLKESLDELTRVGSSIKTQPALAGLDREAVTAWRVSRFLVASGQADMANDRVSAVLRSHPNSPMLWRLRAELDEQSKRLADAVEAHRKLAELDVRRRSEHLLAVAKGLARMGRVEAALEQSEAITTETASSQLVIEVFNLALDNKAEKFAINLLEKRLQARPGDIEVLQRLIRYHLDKEAFQQAAEYQWRNFQLVRTPEQRQVAVQLLIETHAQLRTLNKLEQQLEKYWRQHDQWREFGVWQAMIALRGDNFGRAENLLRRLAQSQTTRRFALENLLRLAESQNNNLKRFELMKQLAAIDPQAINADEIAKVLIDMPEGHRSPQQVQDVLGLVRGSSKRLALIQDLIQAGSVDMALRIIEGLPDSERCSWPVVGRAALLWAAFPVAKNAVAKGSVGKDAVVKDAIPAHVQSAGLQLQSFTEQPLELAETLVGQKMLEELLDSQKYIAELLVTTTYLRNSSEARLSISQEATNCHSALQAYQAVIAAQLQVAQSPAQRREFLSRQRELAMQQSNVRERAVRLAALAIVDHWQSKAPTFQQVSHDVQKLNVPSPASATNREALIRTRLRSLMAAELAPEGSSLVTSLARVGTAFQYVIADLNELADQRDTLAALLCLWEMAQAQRDLLKPANQSMFEHTSRWCRNLGDYEPFAPPQIITLMACLQLKEHPELSGEYLKTLAQLQIDREGLKRLIEMVLEKSDPTLIQPLIASQAGKVSSLELLGELAYGRGTNSQIEPTVLWRAVDYVWQSEVKLGMRSQRKLRQPDPGPTVPWMKALPYCSVPMHESSIFHSLDFSIARAIIARAHSTTDRQDLLKAIKQLADEPADSDLRLVRQLAQVFVLELLEQDTQSAKQLDVALPPDSSAADPSANVLRGLWLDVIGKHDAAIQWWLKFHQWPDEVRESTAGLLLQLGVQAHHDEAIGLAVKELRGANSHLAAYTSVASQLIERGLLPQAETLMGEFHVLLPPTDQPLVDNAEVVKLHAANAEMVTRWQQTDLLFTLLQKYSQAENKEATYRIARRLIGGAETATDDEFRENLVHLVKRLQRVFRHVGQLAEFLEVESHRLDPDASPRQTLCVLRLMSEMGYVSLAQAIVDRMTSSQMTAMQHLEIARCELKLGQVEQAAQFFARAFEFQPDWLDSFLANLNERSQTVEAIAYELNKCSNAGAGIGVAGMDALRKAIPSSELVKYPRLWIDWAGNSRPKSLAQMQSLLVQMRSVSFELWTSVVEQLLLADELQAVSAAYDNSNQWVSGQRSSGIIEQQLLDARMNAEESALFEAMLQRVLAKSSDHFLARLALAGAYLSREKLGAAAEQLPFLVRSVSRGAVKSWLLAEWRTEIVKRNLNTNNQALIARALSQTNGTVTTLEMEKVARAKLLLHLLDNWDSSASQKSNRLQLLEAIVQLNGLPALPPGWQKELLKFYAAQGDEAKVLSLFEPEFRRMQMTHKLSASIPSEWLDVLVENGMDWQRQLIVIRAAQLERLPLRLSTVYVSQLKKDAEFQSGDPQSLGYPWRATPQMLERLVTESHQLLPAADWNSIHASPWCDCFKPQIVVNPKEQTLGIVSMLDALWPLGESLAAEARTPLETDVQSSSKDLASLGAWQTLALHNLAARLGDEPVVERAQERLLELAEAKTTTADRQWRLACWSAVRSSGSISSLAQLRFRLGEVARSAAAQYGHEMSDVYSLMTIAQLELINSGTEPKDPALDKIVSDLMTLVQKAKDFPSWEPDAILTHVKINMLLFERLVAQGHVDLAIDLLRNLRANNFIVGNGSGIAVSVPRGLARNRQTFDLLGTFQRMIDNRSEPEQLQVLLEELLLNPVIGVAGFPVTGNADFSDDFSDFAQASARDGHELSWSDDFDPERRLDELPTQRTMYSQLIQVARINNSLSQLHARLSQDSEKRSAHVVCGALIDLEEGNLKQALATYGELSKPTSIFVRDTQVDLIRDAIFNVVKDDPLGEAAIEYSRLSIGRSMNAGTTSLLRRQFLLATERNQNAAVDDLLTILSKALHVPERIRNGLRIEYAIELLNAQRVKASLDAYVKGMSLSDKRLVKPDRYVIELMNRLPSLGRSEQAEIFRCFLSRESQAFPWLDCYAPPDTQPVPKRFRHRDAVDGLVFRALDKRSAWLSFISWIVEYAEVTGQGDAAVLAATSIAVNCPDVAWGATALTARMNSGLTPGALKNRLDIAGVTPSPPAMQALLDCCQNNESLRAAAVEIILNLGYPAIALASPLKDTESPGWKHWMVMREETLASNLDRRPCWSLAKNGQWTAQTSNDKWYLMLRYPIEGDFQLSVTAQQVSGAKFGVGCGGVAAVQHATDPVVRCLGIGQRHSQDLIPADLLDTADVPLKVERRGLNWTLQAATASFTEPADDSIPIVYFVNQGPGNARLDNWQLSGDLKLARHVDLLDSQMRMWRTTLGSWKLPTLRTKVAEVDVAKTSAVRVSQDILHLPALPAANETAIDAIGSLHCLRPLQPGETIEYEFYAAAYSAAVLPSVGRIVFRLDDERMGMQWLLRADERKWLRLAKGQLFPLADDETGQAVKIMQDAWNKVELSLDADRRIAIRLNGQSIVQLSLPELVVPEVGLTVAANMPAKVRNVRLTGTWPATLSLDELKQLAEAR